MEERPRDLSTPRPHELNNVSSFFTIGNGVGSVFTELKNELTLFTAIYHSELRCNSFRLRYYATGFYLIATRLFLPAETIGMESDEISTIEDPEDAKWAAAQRQIVLDYLVEQRVEHGGVSLEPRWFLLPYVAIWAVRSRANPNEVGWLRTCSRRCSSCVLSRGSLAGRLRLCESWHRTLL
jgi:hypothetical protein